MKVYIAGPISGHDDFNYPAFRSAAEDLRGRTVKHAATACYHLYQVVSPVELDESEGFDPAAYDGGEGQLEAGQYASFLSRDMHVIATQGVEAIVVLPGWEKSGGARTEVAFGQALGLPILAYPSLEPVSSAARDQGEVRIINEQTGGEKGRKPERLTLVPQAELAEVSALYAKGAEKYADHNWRRGFAWSLSGDALLRHFGQFWEGENYDEETGCHHLTSVVFHALALLHFRTYYPDLDDRPNTLLERGKAE